MIRVRLDFILDEETEGLSALDEIGNLSKWLAEVFDNHDTSLWTVETSLAVEEGKL